MWETKLKGLATLSSHIYGGASSLLGNDGGVTTITYWQFNYFWWCHHFLEPFLPLCLLHAITSVSILTKKLQTKKTFSQFKFQFNFENKLILQLNFNDNSKKTQNLQFGDPRIFLITWTHWSPRTYQQWYINVLQFSFQKKKRTCR